jgi:hypothetical protein
MKKFLVSLIILIILGGAACYFGWVKTSVPTGEYGVIISKTHGIDKELVQDGKFRWLWYKLIPTNVKVLTFQLNQMEDDFSASGTLPSSETYASFGGVSMDFSYKVHGSFSFSLKPEVLPSLVEINAVSDQASLQAYCVSLSEKISSYIVQQLQSYSENTATLETLQEKVIPSDLTDNIKSMFPELRDFSGTIYTASFPDFDLYESAKNLYLDYLSRQGEILMEQAAAAAAKKSNAQDRFDELTRYGKLLAEYPHLIQYLAIEKGFDEVMKTLPLDAEH